MAVNPLPSNWTSTLWAKDLKPTIFSFCIFTGEANLENSKAVFCKFQRMAKPGFET
jgi:hypothetical protein